MVNTTGGVDNLVGTGIERVTIATDFNGKFRFGGTHGKNRSAGAGRFRFSIELWVDVFLHDGMRIYE